MKKNLMTLTLLTASFFAFNAFANPATDNKATDNTKVEAPAKGDKGPGMKANRPDPFEGLNLTSEQQEKLTALKDAQKEKRKEAMEQRKAEMEKRRAEAPAPEKMGRNTQQKEYLDGVKSILTTDQYIAFLENMVASQPNRQGGFGQPGMQPFFGQGGFGQPGMQPGFGQGRPGQPGGPMAMRPGKDRKHNFDKKQDDNKKDGQKADNKDKKDKKDKKAKNDKKEAK